MKEHTKKIIPFVALTFLLSWSMAFLFFARGGERATSGYLVMTIAYMFTPMVAAIIVQKLIFREPLKEPLGIFFKPNRWFLVAWLLPPLLALATLGVSLLFPAVTFAPELEAMLERFRPLVTPEQLKQMESQARALPIHPFWIALLQGLIAGPTVNAIAGFGEELGWRGLLQRELRFMGFWRSSLVIGFIWGVWHAPLILKGHNYPQHPEWGALMMIAWTMLLSPLFSWVRLQAHSVIAAAILHGTLNATAGLSILVVRGGDDLTIGVTGLAGLIVLALVNLGLLISRRRPSGADEPL
ncbi:MAG: CPBP family intramembrane metalloprotease [Acidobacteria bacterium]|nr:MAG: CPBP family intramembrane metalloprotease [Acidobacteriota bacterium]